VAPGAALTLENLTLQNGFSEDTGGALFVQPGGLLNCNNTRFLDNVCAPTMPGMYKSGAICIYPSWCAANT
jgi:hypothetical protein